MCGFPVQVRRAAVAAIVAGLLAMPSTALGVVGGTPVNEADYPWFVTIGGCGGALVRPDRVVTSAHCVDSSHPDLIADIQVGATEMRRVARVALYPGGWGFWDIEKRDDVALVRLDRPVTGAPTVALGRRLAERATLLGRGEKIGLGPPNPLAGAELRLIPDSACARAYRSYRNVSPTVSSTRSLPAGFLRARMLCAADPDSIAPLAAACDGDTGGPLVSGPAYAPVLRGIVIGGSEDCGQDGKPTVFTDVRRYRGFILADSPEWAPLPRTEPRIRGRRRPGRRLSCGVSRWLSKPDRVSVTWWRGSVVSANELGRGRTYRVRRSDRGHIVACEIEALNGGGSISLEAPTVYIPR